MANPANCPPLTRPSVVAAHELIKPHIHFTPVLTNTTLSTLASTPQDPSALQDTPWAGQEPAKPVIRLWFKCENLQKVGAFKVRGAFHALTRLINEKGWEEGGGRERGVVTHSSGSLCFFPSAFLQACCFSLYVYDIHVREVFILLEHPH
jgi:threonine dehydratase